ncbi:hypothetical protein PsYK624_163210 [Phanerochaete sordida]|uniref:F-box domain-containing protein n=1 Tax=Phanerochaete sordida TaxID=48140 RepID=A0A9P3GS26_9APHY|nr:hypothetical protein PsYK624_163210 [Phanerochaete sordida]
MHDLPLDIFYYLLRSFYFDKYTLVALMCVSRTFYSILAHVAFGTVSTAIPPNIPPNTHTNPNNPDVVPRVRVLSVRPAFHVIYPEVASDTVMYLARPLPNLRRIQLHRMNWRPADDRKIERSYDVEHRSRIKHLFFHHVNIHTGHLPFLHAYLASLPSLQTLVFVLRTEHPEVDLPLHLRVNVRGNTVRRVAIHLNHTLVRLTPSLSTYPLYTDLVELHISNIVPADMDALRDLVRENESSLRVLTLTFSVIIFEQASVDIWGPLNLERCTSLRTFVTGFPLLLNQFSPLSSEATFAFLRHFIEKLPASVFDIRLLILYPPHIIVHNAMVHIQWSDIIATICRPSIARITFILFQTKERVRWHSSIIRKVKAILNNMYPSTSRSSRLVLEYMWTHPHADAAPALYFGTLAHPLADEEYPWFDLHNDCVVYL